MIGAMSTLARKAGLEVVSCGDRDPSTAGRGITILYTRGISEVER